MARKQQGGSSEVAPISPHGVQIPAGMDDQFDKYAKDVADVSIGTGGWNFISTRAGGFTLRQQALENPMNCVIVGVALENTYYDKPFDPEDFEAPKCTAVGRHEDTIGPPAEWPGKQSDFCRTCWANAWGTSERGGRGKACGNRVRLCVLPIYRGVDLEKVEGARLRVMTTSMGFFDKLRNEVKALNGGRCPIFGYAVEIGIEPDPKNTWRMTFKLLRSLPPEWTAIAMKRVAEAETPLLQVFEPQPEQEERPSPKGGRPKKRGR